MRRSWDLLRKKKQNISDKEVSRQQNLRNGGANFRCPPFLLVSVRCFPPSSPWDSVPHPAKGAFLKKRPLEPSKTFWCVKAKPDSSPFHKKYVARPQKKFSDRPLFQKGAPGAGRGTLKRESGYKEGTLQETPIVRLQALRKCSISFKSIRSWAFSASPPCCLP